MKRILTLLLLAAVSVSILSSCAGTEATIAASSSKKTLALGSNWKDVGVLTNDASTDITVTNFATSGYDVTVRILSEDGTALRVSEKTIPSGYSETFPSVPAGSCTIQAKASDGIQREYTLSYGD